MYKSSQLLKSSNKKIYQYILSAKQPRELLAQAIQNLSRKAIQSSEHFDFLLHRINWFEQPFNHYQHLFLKILRIYRSHSKQSSKVIYNLIIQAFINQPTHQQSLNTLIALFKEAFDKKIIIQSLKENYPHKLCSLQVHILYINAMIELCKQFPNFRTDFLEIMVQNLVNFDTELINGDQFVHKPFPEDQKIITFREYHEKTELSQKLDHLLSILLTYLGQLEEDENIMSEILLVFQNKILPIKTTKTIPFIVLNIVESNKNRANIFLSFLLGNLFDKNNIQNHYRVFSQSNFYLFSYILRSNKITRNTVLKILNLLISKLNDKLQHIQETAINEKTQLKDLFIQQEMNLLILQTIIMIASNQDNFNLMSRQKYQLFLENCSRKLHFEYFIKEQILQKINIDRMDSNTSYTVKFSNKFLPSTLTQVGKIIDSKMKIVINDKQSRIPSDMTELEPTLRKMHKGQNPISFCTETVV